MQKIVGVKKILGMLEIVSLGKNFEDGENYGDVEFIGVEKVWEWDTFGSGRNVVGVKHFFGW